MYNKFLGYLLKEIRKKEKLTQKEIAKILDKSEISIRKYESGSYPVPAIIFFILFMRFKYTFNIILELVKEIEKDYNFSVTLDDFKQFSKELEKYNIKLEKIDDFEIDKPNDIDPDTSFKLEIIELLKNKNISIVESITNNIEEIKIQMNNKNFLINRTSLFKILEFLKNNLISDFKSMIELIENK